MDSCRHGLRRFGKVDAPKSWRRLAKFHFNVATGRLKIALARHLRDDFLPGSLVGEKKQLTGSHRRGEAEDATVFKNQNRGGFFGEEFALAAGFSGSRASGDDGYFVSDGIQFGIGLGVYSRRFRVARRRRGVRMTGVHCGSHDRVVPRAPEGGASSEKASQAESRPHDGPADMPLFQAVSTAAIVQTYCI